MLEKKRLPLRRACRFVWTCTICLGATACAEEGPDPSFSGTDSAGVTIVRSPGVDLPLDWTLVEVLRMGETDRGPTAFGQVDRRGVAADPAGRLYVLDEATVEVRLFDRDGAHIRTMGGEGEGPGEMLRPISLWVRYGGGGIGVLAPTKRAFVRFGPDGSILDELGLPEHPEVRVNAAALVSSGVVMPEAAVTTPVDMLAGTPLTSRLLFFERIEETRWSDPVELATMSLRQPEIGPVTYDGCSFTLQDTPVFTLLPTWRVIGDRLLYNSTAEYALEVVDLGGTRTSIRRDLPVRKGTRELAAMEVGPAEFEFGGQACRATAEQIVDQRGWANEIPWIKDFTVAPDGRFYVLRRDPGQDPGERIDVFRRDGEYVGTLPPEFPFPVTWRGPREMVRLERDEFGRPLVVVYRIHPE